MVAVCEPAKPPRSPDAESGGTIGRWDTSAGARAAAPHSAYEKDKRAFHPPVSPSNYRETEPHGNQVASVLAGTLEDLA